MKTRAIGAGLLAAIGLVAVAAILDAGGGAALAQTAPSAKNGQLVFEQCKVCHSLAAGANLVGPSLHGLFGRHSASIDSFTYSDAMYQADIVWNDDTLAKWVADPSAMVPGTKMLFGGVKDPVQIADLLAYLKDATR